MSSYLVEEKLREAASLGDMECVHALIAQHVNVNAQNRINSWTPLHWAARRGHENVVRVLLAEGADATLETSNGETAATLTASAHIARLLGASPPMAHRVEDIGVATKFIPNYLKHAPLGGRVDMADMDDMVDLHAVVPTTSLVLKLRVHGSCDPDFIEVELARDHLSYELLLEELCREADVPVAQVERIRKLPNTRLRNDNDVRRLQPMQEIELVLRLSGLEKVSHSYQSISACKDQTILY